MEITIETLSGSAFDLKVNETDTILSIKNRIQRHKGVPVNEQHLLWNNEELSDFHTITDYNISDGCTLKLVLGMRGGPINTYRTPPPLSISVFRSKYAKHFFDNINKTSINHLNRSSSNTSVSSNESNAASIEEVAYHKNEESGTKTRSVLVSARDLSKSLQTAERRITLLILEYQSCIDLLSVPSAEKLKRSMSDDIAGESSTDLKGTASAVTSVATHSEQKMKSTSEDDVLAGILVAGSKQPIPNTFKPSRSSILNKPLPPLSNWLGSSAGGNEAKASSSSCSKNLHDVLSIGEDALLGGTGASSTDAHKNEIEDFVDLSHVVWDEDDHVDLELDEPDFCNDDDVVETTDECDEDEEEEDDLSIDNGYLMYYPTRTTTTTTTLPSYSSAGFGGGRRTIEETAVFTPSLSTTTATWHRNMDCEKLAEKVQQLKTRMAEVRRMKKLRRSSDVVIASEQPLPPPSLHLNDEPIDDAKTFSAYQSRINEIIRGRKCSNSKPSETTTAAAATSNYSASLSMSDCEPLAATTTSSMTTNSSLFKLPVLTNKASFIHHQQQQQQPQLLQTQSSSRDIDTLSQKLFSLPSVTNIQTSSGSKQPIEAAPAGLEEAAVATTTITTLNTRRCWFCKRRTGLANSYSCRCGNNFCAQHRYAESHSCSFDYKTEARRILKDSNPVVTATKLPKI